MNNNSLVPQTAPWEYDERRFESEANSDSNSSSLFPDLSSFTPDPVQLVKNGGSFLADAGNAIGELFVDIAGTSKETSKTQIGGQTEIKFNNPKEKEEVQNNQKRVAKQKEIAQQQTQVRSEEEQKKMRAQMIENVNKTIGGISNLSYEGTVNENGALRVDVQTYFEQANSKLSEQQLKEKRQNQIAQVTGKQPGGMMGENELLKGAEDFGHFTKATG